MNDLTNEPREQENIWMRGLYMLLFLLLYNVAEIVMAAVVLLQFGYRIFNNASQPRLLALGDSLASYIYQILLFLSFKSERMPYPFSDWPSAGTGE